jgi:hypothetical protein
MIITFHGMVEGEIMATVLRGKNKGKKVKLCQWCNDWFMIEPGGIITPTSLKLSKAEMEKVISHKNNGMLFHVFELMDDGTFKRRKK